MSDKSFSVTDATGDTFTLTMFGDYCFSVQYDAELVRAGQTETYSSRTWSKPPVWHEPSFERLESYGEDVCKKARFPWTRAMLTCKHVAVIHCESCDHIHFGVFD